MRNRVLDLVLDPSLLHYSLVSCLVQGFRKGPVHALSHCCHCSQASLSGCIWLAVLGIGNQHSRELPSSNKNSSSCNPADIHKREFCSCRQGQADLRDGIGTRWPSFIDQPNSVQCGIADLEMWAFLSIMVARATLLTCSLKASSVGRRTFRSVDLLFRNLYTLSLARSEPSKWSALDW